MALFERTSRRVTLTPAGERLLGDARDVLRVRRPLHRHGGRAGRRAVDLDGRLLPRQRGRDDADDRRLPGRAPRRRGPRRRPDVAADPRRRARPGGSPSASCAARSSTRTGSRRVPLARVPVDHVAVPPGHRLAAVDERRGRRSRRRARAHRRPRRRADGPRRDRGLLRGRGRPAAVDHHAAVQVERVLDLVAVGTGIGWLNSWQAERAAPAHRRRRAAAAPGRRCTTSSGSSGGPPTTRPRPPPSSASPSTRAPAPRRPRDAALVTLVDLGVRLHRCRRRAAPRGRCAPCTASCHRHRAWRPARWPARSRCAAPRPAADGRGRPAAPHPRGRSRR